MYVCIRSTFVCMFICIYVCTMYVCLYVYPGIVRYKTYEVLKNQVQDPRVMWAYLPYSMHMAGPREAVQHMLIRKNYGCTHFIIGRDMAGCKSSISGDDFYGAYDAQNTAIEHKNSIGVTPVPSLNLVFTEEEVSK